eukprot:gb/GFBE01015879.1/.p1 GENE.gb/GFBE01015879.1/~~gb/GFBE01015879.1/.p1  ORF type:complete len:334 (+),score=48.90 gb/GFBE01015879.1/:1-1002(+)
MLPARMPYSSVADDWTQTAHGMLPPPSGAPPGYHAGGHSPHHHSGHRPHHQHSPPGKRSAPRPPPSWTAHKVTGRQPNNKMTVDEYIDGAQAAAEESLKKAMQDAALAYGMQAAKAGAHVAKNAAVHIYTYAESSAWTVKGVAFIVALGMLGFSTLGLINMFRIVIHPFYYLLDVYNICFAVIIIVMEGPEELQCSWCGSFQRGQQWLFGWAAFLSSRTGRALFYFFIGSLNVFMLPEDWFWKLVYLQIGLALMFVGLLSLLDRYHCTTICCPGMRGHVDKHATSNSEIYDDESDVESGESSPETSHAPNQQKIQEMEKLLSADFSRGSLRRH